MIAGVDEHQHNARRWIRSLCRLDNGKMSINADSTFPMPTRFPLPVLLFDGSHNLHKCFFSNSASVYSCTTLPRTQTKMQDVKVFGSEFHQYRCVKSDVIMITCRPPWLQLSLLLNSVVSWKSERTDQPTPCSLSARSSGTFLSLFSK